MKITGSTSAHFDRPSVRRAQDVGPSAENTNPIAARVLEVSHDVRASLPTAETPANRKTLNEVRAAQAAEATLTQRAAEVINETQRAIEGRETSALPAESEVRPTQLSPWLTGGICAAHGAAAAWIGANIAGALCGEPTSILSLTLTIGGVLTSAIAGYFAADATSAVAHWALDNYFDADTPLVGGIAVGFQEHHHRPNAIADWPFADNTYRSAALTGPALVGLALMAPGLFATVAGFTFLNGLFGAQEFHKWTHTPMKNLSPFVRFLQDYGIIVPRREHMQHHGSPYPHKYAIVNGWSNGLLDQTKLFRLLELAVHELTGAIPNTWKLDPRICDEALELCRDPNRAAAIRAALAECTAKNQKS